MRTGPICEFCEFPDNVEQRQRMPFCLARCTGIFGAPRATEHIVKPKYIVIPSYNTLTSCQPTASIGTPLVDRTATVDAPNVVDDGPVSPLSPGASTLRSEWAPYCPGSPQCPRVVEDLELGMSDTPVLRNTYFFDHRSGAGFISIPHLGNHACTTALGIFRVIEKWIEEKLFKYSPVGQDGEEFVPILEENVKSSAIGVVRKLEAAAKGFTGLSCVAVHIRTGHVYTLEDCEDLVVGDEAEHFFQEFPLFVDVSLQLRRCPTPANETSQTQSPRNDEQRVDNPLADSSATAGSNLRSSHWTCIVVKMTSGIKQFEFDHSETILAASAHGPGDASIASSHTLVPPSSDMCASPRHFPPKRHPDLCQLGSRTATPVSDDAEVADLSSGCPDLEDCLDLDIIDAVYTTNAGENWLCGSVDEEGCLDSEFGSEASSLSFLRAAQDVAGKPKGFRKSSEGVSGFAISADGDHRDFHDRDYPSGNGQQRSCRNLDTVRSFHDAGAVNRSDGELVADAYLRESALHQPGHQHDSVFDRFTTTLGEEQELGWAGMVDGGTPEGSMAGVDAVEDRCSVTILTRVMW